MMALIPETPPPIRLVRSQEYRPAYGIDDYTKSDEEIFLDSS